MHVVIKNRTHVCVYGCACARVYAAKKFLALALIKFAKYIENAFVLILINYYHFCLLTSSLTFFQQHIFSESVNQFF